MKKSLLGEEKISLLIETRELLAYYIHVFEDMYADENYKVLYGTLRALRYYAEWQPLDLNNKIKISLASHKRKPHRQSVLDVDSSPFKTRLCAKVYEDIDALLASYIEDGAEAVFEYEEEVTADLKKQIPRCLEILKRTMDM